METTRRHETDPQNGAPRRPTAQDLLIRDQIVTFRVSIAFFLSGLILPMGVVSVTSWWMLSYGVLASDVSAVGGVLISLMSAVGGGGAISAGFRLLKASRELITQIQGGERPKAIRRQVNQISDGR